MKRINSHTSTMTPGAKTLVGEVSLRHLQGNAGNSQLTCEKVLNEQLVYIKSMLLRLNSFKMSHDPVAVNVHVHQRAQESIDEELSRLILKLVNYQGHNPLHRVAAYSQMSLDLLSELEKSIFQNDNNISSIKTESRARQLEATRTYALLTQDVAIKEQTIQSLVSDKSELENENRELKRSNDAIQNELDKALRNQSQTHQHAVEVRMQGLDYKAEVDRHCNRVLSSIQSRMGFIPSSM